MKMLCAFHVELWSCSYANGAATAFVRDVLRLPVCFVKTGVKYLHHKGVTRNCLVLCSYVEEKKTYFQISLAKEFDVGVYFEANGHGTVLFDEAFLVRVRAVKENFNKILFF